MKSLKIAIILLLTSLIVSCSGDDAENVNAIGPDSFEYTIDGEPVAITSVTGQRSTNTIAIIGHSTDGSVIEFQFNNRGDLGEVATYSITDFDVPLLTTFHYFKSNYFDFNLVAIDEANKKVKVTFSGKVYDDEYDINSEYSTIEGSFTTTYQDVQPLEVLGFTASVNGNEWHSTDSGSTSGGFFPDTDVTLYELNDTQYSFGLVTNHTTTLPGTYNFTSAYTSNRMEFYVYDPTSNENIQYEIISGVLKINTKQVGAQFTILSGTFSFTARNPVTDEVVNVIDGDFREVYINY